MANGVASSGGKHSETFERTAAVLGSETLEVEMGSCKGSFASPCPELQFEVVVAYSQ